MQESTARQERRQQLMVELRDINSRRTEIEGKVFDSAGDLIAKLAVIHKLKLVFIKKDFEDDIIIGYLFRNCDETRGKYLLEMKDNIFKYSQEKKENNMTNKNNLEKITSNNNSNINEYLKNNINTNNMNKEQ